MSNLSDFVKVYEKVIPDQLCDELIELMKTSSHKHYQDSGYLRREELSLNIHTHPELFQKVKSIIQQIYQVYKQDIGPTSANLYQAYTMEYPVIVAYKPTEKNDELFHDHADAWHFDSCSRQVSVIMYFSDVKEGGGTYFSNLDIRVSPVKGRVLIFPANFMFIHRAEPPISDIKYAGIAWIHFDGPTKYISMRM
jgi:hypothetical protein